MQTGSSLQVHTHHSAFSSSLESPLSEVHSDESSPTSSIKKTAVRLVQELASQISTHPQVQGTPIKTETQNEFSGSVKKADIRLSPEKSPHLTTTNAPIVEIHLTTEQCIHPTPPSEKLNILSKSMNKHHPVQSELHRHVPHFTMDEDILQAAKLLFHSFQPPHLEASGRQSPSALQRSLFIPKGVNHNICVSPGMSASSYPVALHFDYPQPTILQHHPGTSSRLVLEHSQQKDQLRPQVERNQASDNVRSWEFHPSSETIVHANITEKDNRERSSRKRRGESMSQAESAESDSEAVLSDPSDEEWMGGRMPYKNQSSPCRKSSTASLNGLSKRSKSSIGSPKRRKSSVKRKSSTTPFQAPAMEATSSMEGNVSDKAVESTDQRVCGYCQTTSTPMWRHGPPGYEDLCNKCGVKFMRGRILSDL